MANKVAVKEYKIWMDSAVEAAAVRNDSNIYFHGVVKKVERE